MISSDFSALARTLIDLSDRPVLYWASVCGFHPSNVSNWLRGRETLSESNIARLLSVLSVDPDTLKLDPSRVHVWVVAIHEPESLIEAAKTFFESPSEMVLVRPDPEGPVSLVQAPQVALLRSGLLRIVLLRKLFPTKMSESPLSQKAGTPWIRPSFLPDARWKAKEIPPSEDAPPIHVPGPFLFDLVMGNISLEQFDVILDKATPWEWKDVETLAKSSGLTAKEVADLIKGIKPRKTR
ncbi:helix-turn-helix domain-containing protein [Leptospirillum ferriphilum]|uniref:helix-turn-helix domain-containing protein n=1 Tax=Leptospirillum ferriphilum TaxID=178606 RepID=UPI0006B16D22|nr:helix-turn-helix transcriptional regulator [Leptospirillum ferriphilum]